MKAVDTIQLTDLGLAIDEAMKESLKCSETVDCRVDAVWACVTTGCGCGAHPYCEGHRARLDSWFPERRAVCQHCEQMSGWRWEPLS